MVVGQPAQEPQLHSHPVSKGDSHLPVCCPALVVPQAAFQPLTIENLPQRPYTSAAPMIEVVLNDRLGKKASTQIAPLQPLLGRHRF